MVNGPILDDENRRRQDTDDNLAAINLEYVHGYMTLFRRMAWTAVFVLVILAIGVSIIWTWRATR